MSSEMPVRREAVTNKIREELRNAIAKVLADDIPTSSCLSCVHFKEQQEHCSLYNARPPARIIAYACASYMDNLEVPY